VRSMTGSSRATYSLPFPGGVHEEHRRNVAAWRREVFGGPAEYTEELGGMREPGGYERMLQKHLQLGITKDQRFRFVSLMSLAADDAEMPDDPEFRSALAASRMGHSPGLQNLKGGRRNRRARSDTSLGLGRSTALSAVGTIGPHGRMRGRSPVTAPYQGHTWGRHRFRVIEAFAGKCPDT
jgi:truncated hemoglobin YjbI